MAPAMKKKRVAKGFCVKEAANRILKNLAAMRKRAKPEDCTLRRVEGRLGRGPRRRWRLPGGREACWGLGVPKAAQMTVMVVDPDADIEKIAGMVPPPAIRQCTFRGALVAERL